VKGFMRFEARRSLCRLEIGLCQTLLRIVLLGSHEENAELPCWLKESLILKTSDWIMAVRFPPSIEPVNLVVLIYPGENYSGTLCEWWPESENELNHVDVPPLPLGALA
jgi:hypothetical protein